MFSYDPFGGVKVGKREKGRPHSQRYEVIPALCFILLSGMNDPFLGDGDCNPLTLYLHLKQIYEQRAKI